MGFFFKTPEHSKKSAHGMGYKSDGRKTREKPGNGKQRMLLSSTKLLLDNITDDNENPYAANRRIDNNVYQMFSDGKD
ncbi:hypothetical protein FACS1894208_00960 [Clostridia bacterium]|nr:hypothetical protein FACS1894208_00960 [Clostridia bacterium]